MHWIIMVKYEIAPASVRQRLTEKNDIGGFLSQKIGG
jgi:hypothetical protein